MSLNLEIIMRCWCIRNVLQVLQRSLHK